MFVAVRRPEGRPESRQHRVNLQLASTLFAAMGGDRRGRFLTCHSLGAGRDVRGNCRVGEISHYSCKEGS